MRRKAQRGVALILAMLVVTLVATLASAMLWQQWRRIEAETADRYRAQAAWILSGALDWARLILREDGRNGGADHLAEPWAVPLREARLASFLAAQGDGGAAGGTSGENDPTLEAFLAGQITDAQGKLNFANLASEGAGADAARQAFGRLFEILGLPGTELAAVTAGLVAASAARSSSAGGASGPLLPRRFDDLVWLGASESTLRTLAPHATLLPVATPLNLNTASAEAITAAVPGLDRAGAQRMADARMLKHFRSLGDAATAAGIDSGRLTDAQHGIASRFFEVLGSIRIDQHRVTETSLVQRDGANARTLWRDRTALASADATR